MASARGSPDQRWPQARAQGCRGASAGPGSLTRPAVPAGRRPRPEHHRVRRGRAAGLRPRAPAARPGAARSARHGRIGRAGLRAVPGRCPARRALRQRRVPAGEARGVPGGYRADPRQYTTAAAVADLDEVRDALGYATINLWGASYGTRLGLAYLRATPSGCAAPCSTASRPRHCLPLYFARDGQRALDLLLQHCAPDSACAAAFPDLAARLDALLERLRAAPLRTSVTHPVTGRREPLMISFEAFVGGLRGALYSPEVATLVPLTIDRAMAGDFAPFVAMSLAFEELAAHESRVVPLRHLHRGRAVHRTAGAGQPERGQHLRTRDGPRHARGLCRLAAGYACRRRARSRALGRAHAAALRRAGSGHAAGLGRAGSARPVPQPPRGRARRRPRRDQPRLRTRPDGPASSPRRRPRSWRPTASALARPPFFVTFAGPQP